MRSVACRQNLHLPSPRCRRAVAPRTAVNTMTPNLLDHFVGEVKKTVSKIPAPGETKAQFEKRMREAGVEAAEIAQLVAQFFSDAGKQLKEKVEEAWAEAGQQAAQLGGDLHEFPPPMDIHLSGGLGQHVPVRATLGGGDKALEANLGGGAKPLEANLGGGKTPLAANLSAVLEGGDTPLAANLGGGKTPVAATLGGGKDPVAMTAALGGTKQPILLGPFSFHLGDFKLLHDVKFTLKWGDQIPILSLTIKGVNRADQTPN